MIFLYLCKFFVPKSEGPPLTLYTPGDSQDHQSFDYLSIVKHKRADSVQRQA